MEASAPLGTEVTHIPKDRSMHTPFHALTLTFALPATLAFSLIGGCSATVNPEHDIKTADVDGCQAMGTQLSLIMAERNGRPDARAFIVPLTHRLSVHGNIHGVAAFGKTEESTAADELQWNDPVVYPTQWGSDLTFVGKVGTNYVLKLRAFAHFTYRSASAPNESPSWTLVRLLTPTESNGAYQTLACTSTMEQTHGTFLPPHPLPTEDDGEHAHALRQFFVQHNHTVQSASDMIHLIGAHPMEHLTVQGLSPDAVTEANPNTIGNTDWNHFELLWRPQYIKAVALLHNGDLPNLHTLTFTGPKFAEFTATQLQTFIQKDTSLAKKYPHLTVTWAVE